MTSRIPSDTLMLRALRRERLPRPPVWLMRQAGRYLPEYRELRLRTGGFLEMAKDPELAAEVTLQPVRRFGMDAAILFSDILLPLAAMGMPLVFEETRGPVLPAPLRDERRVAKLAPIDPSRELAYVGAALRLVRAELPPEVALLGFCGAPFTLASYAVEGGTAKSHAHLRRMMYHEPLLFERLMDKLAVVVGDHLAWQIECGAQAVVLFDTWAGSLSREDYLRYARPWTERALEPSRGKAPRLIFVLEGGHLLDDVASLGTEGIAIDWKTPLVPTLDRYGSRLAVQGNLDPGLLLAPPEEVARRTRELLAAVGGRPGHIMAPGHGVLKETDPAAVAAFVETVKAVGAVGAPAGRGSAG